MILIQFNSILHFNNHFFKIILIQFNLISLFELFIKFKLNEISIYIHLHFAIETITYYFLSLIHFSLIQNINNDFK